MRGQGVQFALTQLHHALAVDMDFDPVADWGMCGNSEEVLFAFVHQLAGNGTPTQKDKASEIGTCLDGHSSLKHVSTRCGRCCSPRPASRAR